MVRFAVTGMERSGTNWLALVLDHDPAVKVYHEPDALKTLDVHVMDLAHAGRLDVDWFVKARYAYWNLQARNGHEDRGEVNSVIRYVAGAIRDICGIPVAGLVRDGRYTVRSLYKRGTFHKAGVLTVQAPEEIWADSFACCCWYWADAYNRLEAQGIPLWRLEDLNENFGALASLCGFLGIEADWEAWQRFSGQRVAVSILDERPPVWNEARRGAFDRWAGEAQARYGYEGAT